MSLYSHGQPTRTQQISDQTRGHKSMAGAMSLTFRCRKCSGDKSVTGRKKHPKGGWVCRECQA